MYGFVGIIRSKCLSEVLFLAFLALFTEEEEVWIDGTHPMLLPESCCVACQVLGLITVSSSQDLLAGGSSGECLTVARDNLDPKETASFHQNTVSGST